MGVINTLMILFGGLLNRIRGGLRIPFTDKKFPLNKLYFPLFIGGLIGYSFNDWWQVLNGFTACYIGQQLAHGKYYGFNPEGDPDVFKIDYLLKKWGLDENRWQYGAVGIILVTVFQCYLIGTAIHQPLFVLTAIAAPLGFFIGKAVEWFIENVFEFSVPDKMPWNTGEIWIGLIITASLLGALGCIKY